MRGPRAPIHRRTVKASQFRKIWKVVRVRQFSKIFRVRRSFSNSHSEYEYESEQSRWLREFLSRIWIRIRTRKGELLCIHIPVYICVIVVLVLHHSWWWSQCHVETEKHSGYNSQRNIQVVYYESMKRNLKIKPTMIYACRCDERLQTKRFTRLSHTGLVVELEHLKIKTRLTNEKFASVEGECEI
jgi:hypothetical protein